MGLEAKSAAWDVEREIDREAPAAPTGPSNARADFLANLGRRVAELLAMLAALKAEPGSPRLRDDLRRRLHALGAGARLLRFDRLAEEVASAEGILAEVAGTGELSEAVATELRGTFSKLAGLGFAGKEAGPGSARAPGLPGGTLMGVGALKAGVGGGQAISGSEPPPSMGVAVTPNPWPLSILVVGPKPIADALVVPAAEGASSMDVERTDDGLRAIDLARAVAPDVVVVDADLRGARELVDALRKDPLTASVAIVAIGTWGRAEEASAFLAVGATRAVHKPVSPDALRRVCREASADRGAGEAAAELGLVSLPELSARLAKEIEKAIADGASAQSDGARVDLGRGDEVLGAIWTAAARVRDLVTIKSRGGIRFAPGMAERATPVGAWMNDAPGATSAKVGRGGVRSGALGTKALAGARVLVADDDPAVAWFLSGVLRAEGATVSEACDGAVALRKAMESTPDLVLTDVLMPNLDGLTLTEVLRADPILSDVAVVLLSWKDDLLQRARELGSRADAYLRKDASGPTVAARVRELFYPRARLAERIAAGGEVHGRVDGVTMRTLLALVCTHRPACVVEVRDAACLYEIVIEGGRPVNATRTAKDGTFVSGAGAFAKVLGVRAGRFVIAAARSEGHATTLTGSLEELVRPHAAAARGAAKLLRGAQIAQVGRVVIEEEWLAAYGSLAPEPARALVRRLAAGEAPRKLLGSGMWPARWFEEVVRDACARGAITEVHGAQGEDLLAAAVQAEMEILMGAKPVSLAPPGPAEEGAEEVSPSGVVVAPAGIVGAAMAPAPSLMANATAEDLVARGAPTGLPPAVNGEEGSPSVDVEVGDWGAARAGEAKEAGRVAAPLDTLGSLTPPPAAPRIEPEVPRAPVIKVPRSVEAIEEARPSRRARAEEEDDDTPAPRRSKKERAASKTPEAPGVKPNSRVGIWVMCAVAGIVFAVGARISQERRAQGTEPAATPAAAAPATTSAPVAQTAVAAAPSVAPVISAPGESPEDPILPQEAPLRSDEKIPSGQGLLEVITGPQDAVSIDGKPTVAGPVVKATLAPRDKPYEIRVKMRGEERVRFAMVREGKRTRLRIAPPWNR